jgi:DNA-binding beta-propeller fold protein YncE
VEGRFDHFTADLKRGRLYLAALGNDTLEVLDLRTGKRLKSLTGEQEPQGVAYAPDLDRVVVGNGEGRGPTSSTAIPTSEGARTGYYVPELSRLYLAVPHRGSQGAEVRIYETQP